MNFLTFFICCIYIFFALSLLFSSLALYSTLVSVLLNWKIFCKPWVPPGEYWKFLVYPWSNYLKSDINFFRELLHSSFIWFSLKNPVIQVGKISLSPFYRLLEILASLSSFPYYHCLLSQPTISNRNNRENKSTMLSMEKLSLPCCTISYTLNICILICHFKITAFGGSADSVWLELEDW